jgi:membrane protein DedA with SNARE-associated domain
MHPFLNHPYLVFFMAHALLAYCVLFFFLFLEGEIAIVIGGIFVHLGILSMGITVALVVIAALLKMFAGYRFGAWLGRTYPESGFLKYIEHKILYFLPQFREKPFWSLFLSKFIYGVNNVALVFSGYVRADFATYLKAEVLSSAIWLGGLFWLGLFFSSKALSISHSFHNFSLLIGLFIVGFVIILRAVKNIIEIVEEWGTRA